MRTILHPNMLHSAGFVAFILLIEA
jgi:hypothetical protein